MLVRFLLLSSWLLGALLCTTSVAAQSMPVRLTYKAPVSCPNQTQVLDKLHEWVTGSDRSRYDSIDATVAMVQTDEGWALYLRTLQGGQPGERTVVGDNCEQLADSVVLILALMLDPSLIATSNDKMPVSFGDTAEAASLAESTEKKDAHGSSSSEALLGTEDNSGDGGFPLSESEGLSSEGAGNAVGAPDGSTAPTIADADAGADELPKQSSVLLMLGGGGVGNIGTLPGGGGGGRLLAGMLWRRWVFQLSFGGLFPKTTTVAGTSGEARLGFWGGEISAGGRLRAGAVWLALNAQLGLGRVQGSAQGVIESDTGGFQMVTLAAVPSLWIPLGQQLAVGLHLVPVFPLKRGRFYVENAGVVHETPQVLFTFGLDLLWFR